MFAASGPASEIGGEQHAMRRIEIEDGLTVRFPGREGEFADGVEIGVLAALMGMGVPVIARAVALSNIEQARALAEKLGYRLVVRPACGETVRVELRRLGVRPQLKVV